MSATNYLELEILDHVLGKGTRDFTSPTTLAVGLFTAVADGEAGTVTEVSGNGYARTAVTFNTAASGSATNDGDITFGAANGGSFGTITHIGVFDATTGGNLLFYGALSASKQVDDGDIFQISDTNLSISLD